jgi:hypothetical protein
MKQRKLSNCWRVLHSCNTCVMGKSSAPDCRSKATSCHAYLPRYYQARSSRSTFKCTLKSQFDNTIPMNLAYLRSRQCMENGVYNCVCVWLNRFRSPAAFLWYFIIKVAFNFSRCVVNIKYKESYLHIFTLYFCYFVHLIMNA